MGERQLGIAIIDGLTICFRHIRIFTLSFEYSGEYTKKQIRRLMKLRKSLYSLFGSLNSLEHLSLTDRMQITVRGEASIGADLAGLFLSHSALADSITHMTQLRSFYYDLKYPKQRKSTQHLTQLPDALIHALTRSKQLRAIAGSFFVQNLTEEQWITLLSSHEHIECLVSVNRDVMNRFMIICGASSEIQTHAHNAAITRIRSLRMLDHARPLESNQSFSSFQPASVSMHLYSLAAEIGAHQLRSIHLHVADGSLEWSYSPSFNMLAPFTHLTSLTIDLQYFQYFQNVNLATLNEWSSTSTVLPSFLHLRELTLIGSIDKTWMKHFLSSLVSLRCLNICDSQSVNAVTLLSWLSACNPGLLELRLRNCGISGLLPAIIVKILKAQVSLHLLTFDHITLPASRVAEGSRLIEESEFDLGQLARESSKAARMIQAAKVLTWIDLLLLDREVIQRRLKTAASSTSHASSSSYSSSSSLLTALHRYSGVGDWRDRWLQVQQIDRLKVMTTRI